MKDWLRDFDKIRADFDSSRGCLSAVVRVTFFHGDHVYAYGMQAGPGDDYLTIYPYPDDLDREMVDTPDGLRVTPSALLVPFATVARVELLTEVPSRKPLGFGGTALQAGSP